MNASVPSTKSSLKVGGFRPERQQGIYTRNWPKLYLRTVVEYPFTILALMFFANGFFIFLIPQDNSIWDVAEGNSTLRLIFAVIYLLSALLILVHYRRIWDHLKYKMSWAFLLPLSIALLSILWSFDPSLTLRRNIALVGTTLFGVYFGARFTPKQQLRLLVSTIGLLGLLSIVTVILLPEYGLELGGFTEPWRGVFLQKNGFGRAMAIGIIAAILLAHVEKQKRLVWRYWGMTVFFGLLLLAAQSVGAFLALMSLVPAWMFYFTNHMNRNSAIMARVVIPMGFLFMLGVSILALEPLLSLLGKDLALTGRSGLWQGMWLAIQESPWLGYGYGAFWIGWDGPSAIVWQWMSYTTFRPLHGHSAFMDILAQLGYTGFAVIIVSLVTALWRAHSIAVRTRNFALYWPVFILFYIFVYSLIESLIMGRNTLTWVLHVSVLMWLGSDLNAKGVSSLAKSKQHVF